jgi:hypothetical protein
VSAAGEDVAAVSAAGEEVTAVTAGAAVLPAPAEVAAPAAVPAPAPLAAGAPFGTPLDEPAAPALAAYAPADAPAADVPAAAAPAADAPAADAAAADAPIADAPPAAAPERSAPPGDNGARREAGRGVRVSAAGTDAESARRRLVAEVQRALRREGLDPGPEDGLEGPRTRAAMRLYERRVGLPEDGVLDLALLRRLGVLEPTPARGDALARDRAPGGFGDALTGVLDGMGRALDDLFLGKDAAREGASSGGPAGRRSPGGLQSGSGR